MYIDSDINIVKRTFIIIKRTIEHAWYVANPLERAVLIFAVIVIILGIFTLIVKG